MVVFAIFYKFRINFCAKYAIWLSCQMNECTLLPETQQAEGSDYHILICRAVFPVAGGTVNRGTNQRLVLANHRVKCPRAAPDAGFKQGRKRDKNPSGRREAMHVLYIPKEGCGNGSSWLDCREM